MLKRKKNNEFYFLINQKLFQNFFLNKNEKVDLTVFFMAYSF